jgi:hypothetical protein
MAHATMIDTNESGDGIAPAPPGDAPAAPGQRWDRQVDTAVVIVLALASLLAAWGGYQATLWSGDQSSAVAAAEQNQIDATRAATTGYQLRQIDATVFVNWLNASVEGNADLAELYETRFSDRLRPAFDAWMATDPFASPNAPRYPFEMAEYQVPQLQEAAALDEEAHEAFAAAEQFGTIGDTYVLATLLLAVVLFVGGVCTKIGWRPAQLFLLGTALLLLLYSVAQLAGLPDGSPWGLTPLWT